VDPETNAAEAAAENAGEFAASMTEMAVESAVAEIEGAVERAEERAERAEEAAEAIADAVVEISEREHIASLETKVAQCLEENQGLKNQLTELQTSISMLTLQLIPPASSTFPVAETTVVEETTPPPEETTPGQVQEPSESEGVPPVEDKPEPPRRKRRWLR